MKIVAFNYSPRMKKSNTEKILNPLLEGARNAGAEAEIIYARKLNLKPCLGCYNCWFKTPGSCVQKDDWSMVLQKKAEADVIIYGTPVYALNMTVFMKSLLDRIGMLVIQPFLVGPNTNDSGYHFHHYARYPDNKKKVILIANGLGWDDAIFGVLVENFKIAFGAAVNIEGEPVMEIAGKILVGCGDLLAWEETPQQALEPFYQALRNAGEELVKYGKLSPQIEENLNVPLWTYLGVKPHESLDFVNKHFRKMIG